MMERVHGHVRILRDGGSDDFWDLVGLIAIGLAVFALWRLASP